MKKGKTLRRKGALERLKAQLDSGTKTKKKTINEKKPLSEKDVKRIEREVSKLEAIL